MVKKVARCQDIPEGKSLLVILEDGKEIAIFNVKGQFYALENSCPHMQGPLHQGEFENCIVTCPWHGWQFDVRDGICINMFGEDVKKIHLTVQDGFICL